MRRRLRSIAGAALALYLGVVASILFWNLGRGDPALWGVIATVIVAGVPVGIVLGWRFGPRVGQWNPFALIGWMGVSAVLLGDAEIVALIFAAELVEGRPQSAVAAPILYFGGLILAPFVLPVTLAAATIWFAIYATLDGLARRAAKGPGVAGASSVVRGGSA